MPPLASTRSVMARPMPVDETGTDQICVASVGLAEEHMLLSLTQPHSRR